MNCVNRHSTEFKNLVKELDIHPDLVEVYVHTYQNSQYALDYQKKHGDLPFPSKAYIEEQFLTNTSTGSKAIKEWARAMCRYDFGNKEFDTIQAAKNAQKDIARQLKIPVNKVPLVCTTGGKYKVMYNRPAINNTRELTTLLQSTGIVRPAEGKLMLNYIGEDIDGYFNAIDNAYKLLDSLNITREAINIQEGEVTLKQEFSDTPKVLTSENPIMQRSVLEERKKLGALNHSFATRGGRKNDAKYLKQGSISQHIQTVILKALEANPTLRQFTPLQVFNMITKQYEGDIAEDYEKHIKKPVIAALEKHLTDYLKKYNVEIKEDAEQFGEDVFGVYDILNKTIHLAKNRNALTLTEEFAHAFIELLGSKVSNKVENKDYTFLYNNVEETSIYKKVFEEYKDTYKNKYGKPDIAKIKKEAIGQALAVIINNQWKSVEEKEKSWFQAIKDWFLELLDHFSEMEYVNFDTLINTMAKEVLQKDYSRLNKVHDKGYKLLDYAETFAEQAKVDNGKALGFMQSFCKEFGAVITGSIAYRYQGTVYRKSADALHDIDMIIQQSAHGISASSPVIKAAVRNNTFGSNHLLNVLKEQPYFKAVQAKYPNLELLAAYPGAEESLTVNSIYSDNPELKERFKNLTGSYAKRLESFTEEEKKQMYLFDFFLEGDSKDYVEDPERSIFLQDSNRIFKAKLGMGRAKDIFDYQMWSRYEDFHNSKVSPEDYLMYQKGKVTYDMFNPQQKETTDKVVEFLQGKGSSEGYYLISGKAGTGKTTIINEIINKYSQNTDTKPNVYVGAISNKATQVLAGKIDVIAEALKKKKVTGESNSNSGAGSIAAIFGQAPKYDEDGNEIWDMTKVFALLQAIQNGSDIQNPPPIVTFNSNTILFIDECSMLDETKMFVLEAFQKLLGFKMIMMGDAGQVEPVKTNATADYSNIINATFPNLAPLFEKQDRATTPTTSLSFKHTAGKSLLTERMRQGEDNPILMQADMFWQIGTYDLALNPLDLAGTTCVDLTTGSGIIYQNTSQDPRNPLDSVAEIVQQGIAENNPDKVRIVAYTNKAVQAANEAIYATLHPETTKAERDQQVVKDKEVLTWYNSQTVKTGSDTNHQIVNSESLIVTDGSEPISLENDPAIAKGLKQLRECVKFPEAIPVLPKDIKMQYVTATIEGQQVKFAIVCPGSRLAYKEYKAKLFGFMTRCSTNKWFTKGAKDAWAGVQDMIHPGEVALGYAITTHKSQGSTFDVTVVDYEDFKKASAHRNPNATDQEKANQNATIARLLYTAYTRSSNITFVYHTNDSDNLDNGYQNQSQTLRELNDAANKAKGRKVTPITQKPLTQQVEKADAKEDSWKSIVGKVDKMFAQHANKISFDEETHTYYYHPQGKTSTVVETCTGSVTTYTTPFEQTDNPLIKTAGDIATRLGNTVDTFLRDYFDKGTEYYKTQNYPNLNNEDKEAMAEIAGKLKHYLDTIYGNTKYIVKTADFSLIGKIKDEEGNYQLTGGTVDMIIFDEEGNYRILDFKTSRTDITGNDHHKLDSYKDQVNTYRVLFEKMHPEYAGKFKGGMLFQLQTSYTPSDGNWSFVGKQVMRNGINIQDTVNWTAPKLFGPLGGTIGASIIQVSEAQPQKHWYQNGEFKSAPMEITGPRESPKTAPAVQNKEVVDLASDAYNTLSFSAYRPITLGGHTFQSLAHAAIARIAYSVDQGIYNEILGINTYNPNIFHTYMQKLQTSPKASKLPNAMNNGIVKIFEDIKQSFTDQNKATLASTEEKEFLDDKTLPIIIREAYQNALASYRKELQQPATTEDEALKLGTDTGSTDTADNSQYFQKHTSEDVITKDIDKPWKSDIGKANPARQFFIKDKEGKGYFELVKDEEDGFYSIHFKPVKDDKTTFTYEEKQELTKAVMEALPEGSYLSTRGSITNGGINGLRRIASHNGFVKVDERTLVSKETKQPVNVPVILKESSKAHRIANKHNSDAYNKEGKKRLAIGPMNHPGIKEALDRPSSKTVAVFTDNAQAYVEANNRRGNAPLDTNWMAQGYNKGTAIRLNVEGEGNSAALRARAENDIRYNAIGLTVKKYQQKVSSNAFLAKEGQFQDTDSDFALFKVLNRHAIARIKKGMENDAIDTVIFPRQMALGRAALPYRFAEWLLMELNDAFDAGLTIEDNIQKINNSAYEGYGLNLETANFTNSKEGNGRPVQDAAHPAASYTLHSGGALGADYAWGKRGEQWGLGKANHYYTGAPTTQYMNTSISKEDILEGKKMYPIAARMLGRKTSDNDAILKSIISSWVQAKNADALYGVIEDFDDGIEYKQPKGGTGYTLMFGAMLHKPVYVFSEASGKWYRAHYDEAGQFTRFREYSNTKGENMTPTLTKDFAGVGTGNIHQTGQDAIEAVYQKTFNTVERQKGIIEEEAQYESDKDYVNKVIKDAVSVQAQEDRKSATRRFFTEKEKESIETGVGKVVASGRTLVPLKVFSASRHTDAIFYVDQIINELKKNAQYPIGHPKRVYAMEFWSKHDGIPMIKILEACKKYRVAPMVSFSITSLGGTDYEPGVMKPKDLIVRIKDLINKGYLDPNTTTVRLDPIVPGVTKAEDLQEIVSELKAAGITKYVTSLMQSYGYTEGTATDRGTIKAMADKGYNWDEYYDRETKGPHKGKLKHYPKLEVIKEWRDILHKLRDDNGIILESCAFNNLKLDVSACLDPETIKAVTGIENLEESTTKERQTCKCYGHKSDLLALTDECYSSCAYCYAAQSDSNPLRFYDKEGNLIDDKYGITRTELTEEKAENLRKEEAESEVQKLAKLPMNPGIIMDRPSSLFSPEDIELIHQRETLMNCNLFTGTQLMDLARAAALKFSEVITKLSTDPNAKQEYFPEGSKWLDKDYTSMSRIEIINTLTPATIFSIVRETTFTGINNPNIDKIKRKNLKKLFFISNNWQAFLEMTLKPLMNAESISINSAAGQIVDLSTAEDTLLDDPQEVAETLGSSVETWQVGFRQVSAHNSLSQLLKSFLGNLDKIDETKIDTEGMVPKMTEFGTIEKVDSSEAVNKILLWCQGARTLSEMIEKLEAHDQRTDPWIVQVINALEDENNSTFQSQFFSNFKKYFQPYMIQYRKGGPEGPMMHKVINNKALGSALLEEYQAKWQSRKDNTLSLYTKEGRISAIAARSINAQIESLVTVKDNVRTEQARPIRKLLELQSALLEPSETDYKNAAQSLQIISQIFDIELSDTDAMNIVQSDNLLGKVWQDIVYVNRAIQSNLNDINYSLYTDSKITSNLQELFEILTNWKSQLESCSYENGKMHYSYVTPSYLTNLVDKLKGNVADYGEMLNKEYGQYGWFKRGNQWRLEILDKLAKDAGYRENFGHYVLLSTDKIGYTEKSPKDYVMSMLQLYFSGTTYDAEGNPTHSKWGFFRVPIMSNKPSEEYIRMEKYTGRNYKERIKEQLVQMIQQEADRINTCRERVKQGKKTIKNFDKNGQKFVMMSFMQKYLEAYHKAKVSDPATDFTNLYSIVQNSLANREDLSPIMENNMYQAAIGNILEKMIDNSYASNSIEDALLDLVLEEEMSAQFEDFKKYLQDQGVLYRNESLQWDLDNLKACNLGNTEETVMDNLENFYWNDFLGANVIMQLTVTDTAYYKDTEDLQKRLAQIHAPGLRCNIEATWEDPKTHQQVRVADEHTRTIYLKDFDNVVSSAIENVRQVFQVKYEKLLKENPEEAAIFRETSNAIVEQFKGINVADAQGYSSITSYRKKAIMFGKWSNQLEDTYQKIRSGKYTSRDLNMALQPLKPFVYSNTKKSSPGTLGNLKVGVQNKNSEYLLIMLDAITQGENGAQNSKLSAIYNLMEESHYDEQGNYKVDGIDTVQFESTVKAGLQGAIDINNAKDAAEAKQILEDAVYTNGRGSQYKEEVVHVLDYEDYCLQSEVPAHLEGSSIFGSQTRILSISDLPLQTNGVDNTIKFRGKDITVKELKDRYNKANVDNIYHSFNTLVKELNLKGTQADRNIAISQLLQDTIKKDGRYGYELLYAVSTDEYGRFNMPLSDPTIAGQVQSLLNSLIKTRINKQQIEGGPVVQVTNYGASKQLEIKFKDKDGNELPTLKEFYENRMNDSATTKFAEKFKVIFSKKNGSQTPSYSFQEFIDMAHYENTSDSQKRKLYKEVYLPIIEAYNKEVVSKQHSMAYMECYAPSTVFEEYADDKGFIDINKVPKEKLELIGYRIPTESKYSMAPLKIKGFLPHEAGEGIMLPYEITLLSGSDFKQY